MYIRDQINKALFQIVLSERDLRLADQRRKLDKGIRPGYIPSTLIAPDKGRVWGFDCSHWNGRVNMATAKANGADFVIIKMADGTVKTNFWEENFAAAKAAGLIRGCYVWLYPSDKVSVTLQVQAWWNLIKNNSPDLPLFIDFEWTYWGGQPANPTINDLRAAVTLWTQLSGKKPMVYTSVGYIGTVGSIPVDLVDKTAGLWVAHYGTVNPSIPKYYTSWDFHQFTSEGDGMLVGYDPGVSKAADFNYWRGTYQELLELTGVVTMPEDLYEGTVLDGEFGDPLCVLREASINAVRAVRTLPPGAVVTGTVFGSNGVVWLETEDGLYVPVRLIDDGGSIIEKYMTLRKIETQPPPDEDLPSFGRVEINGKVYEATDWSRIT